MRGEEQPGEEQGQEGEEPGFGSHADALFQKNAQRGEAQHHHDDEA